MGCAVRKTGIRRQGGCSAARAELLPSRMFLSSTLTDGTLAIVGTEGDDRVIVAVDTRYIDALVVGINEQYSYYSLAAVGSVKIDALGGRDRVMIDASLDAM